MDSGPTRRERRAGVAASVASGSVMADMRARLYASDDPRRIFKVSVEAAWAAGLVGAQAGVGLHAAV